MLHEVLQQTYFKNTVRDYIISVAIFITAVLIITIIKKISLHRLRQWSEKTSTTIDNFLFKNIEEKLIPIIYFGAFYLSLKQLVLTDTAIKVINISAALIITFFAIKFVISLINYSLERYWLTREIDKNRQQRLKGIISIFKILVWALGFALLFDNLGFDISTLVAGLGIGGIAVALAAQAILGDLFSYFVIFFDRPFEIGDFIIVGEHMGSIEHIGIKTTRVRSLSGEQLVFSNTDLTNSRIRNYKRMANRRILFKLGVTYQTALQELKAIPDIIKKSIDNVEDTVFDRSHFSSYGDFSLDFETVYYVQSGDYGKYMDIQQEINFAIKEEFDKAGIEFAYPTQTLFMETPEQESAKKGIK